MPGERKGRAVFQSFILESVSPSSAEILQRTVALFDPTARCLHVILRNGHPHLALPKNGEAAQRTLSLYQPQRPAGRLIATTLRYLAKSRLHSLLARTIALPAAASIPLEPPLPPISPGTCGLMLGSPEHRIRRAIASYRAANGWEVAKVAFGPAGIKMLAQEATTLVEFSARTTAAPACLGLHCGQDVTILRMPRIGGIPLATGSFHQALALLDAWISVLPPRPAATFPEWIAITNALTEMPGGPAILGRISKLQLTPVLRHGDFARWNLLVQPDGTLIALDWEWGGTDGMPGLDLVHYFLQDARLVRRFAPTEAIASTLADLRRPEAAAYLARTGWDGDTMLPLIASLAYKQGAKQQDNENMLDAAVKINLKTKLPER